MGKAEKRRRIVLSVVREAGAWTPRDAFRFGNADGCGSAEVYEALHRLVEKGKLVHSSKTEDAPECWRVA